MKIKKIIIIALLLITGAGISAQNEKDYSIWKDFDNNLYVDGGIGVSKDFLHPIGKNCGLENN